MSMIWSKSMKHTFISSYFIHVKNICTYCWIHRFLVLINLNISKCIIVECSRSVIVGSIFFKKQVNTNRTKRNL